MRSFPAPVAVYMRAVIALGCVLASTSASRGRPGGGLHSDLSIACSGCAAVVYQVEKLLNYPPLEAEGRQIPVNDDNTGLSGSMKMVPYLVRDHNVTYVVWECYSMSHVYWSAALIKAHKGCLATKGVPFSFLSLYIFCSYY